MSRKRLTWGADAAGPLFNKNRSASGAPALPNEGFGHPAAYDDPEIDDYMTGDPSSWGEDPFVGEIRTAPAPAIPVDDGGYRHPAALEGAPMRNASRLMEKADLRIRLAKMMLLNGDSKIASDPVVSRELIKRQAVSMMNVPDGLILDTIRRIEAATLDEKTLIRKMIAEEKEEDVKEEEPEKDSVASKKARLRRLLAEEDAEEEEKEEPKEDSVASKKARLRRLLAEEDAEEEDEDEVASKKAAQRLQAARKHLASLKSRRAEEEEETKEEKEDSVASKKAKIRKLLAEVAEEEEEKKEDSVASKKARLRRLLAEEDAKEEEKEEPKEDSVASKKARLRKFLAEEDAKKNKSRVATDILAELQSSIASLREEVASLRGQPTASGEEYMAEEYMAEDFEPASGEHSADLLDLAYDEMMDDSGIIMDQTDSMGFSEPDFSDEDTELLGSIFGRNASEDAEEEPKEEPKKEASLQTASKIRPQPKKQGGVRTASAGSDDLANLANLWDPKPDLKEVLSSTPLNRTSGR